jgi:hypothetical protein
VNTLSLQAVTLVASKIEDTLTKCLSYEQRASILDLEDFRITGTKLEERRHSCTELPSTTTFRGSSRSYLSLPGTDMSIDEIAGHIGKVMASDKAGLLDLILYAYGHKETRKSARKKVWSM